MNGAPTAAALSSSRSSGTPKPIDSHQPPPPPKPAASTSLKSLFANYSEEILPDSMPPPPPVPPTVPVELSGDSRLKTYDTMRKMLPEGAVRQKMKMDGIPDADIDAYFGAGSNVSAASNR